jgi:hypothetical protein
MTRVFKSKSFGGGPVTAAVLSEESDDVAPMTIQIMAFPAKCIYR